MLRMLAGLPVLGRVWLYSLLVGAYSGLAVWKEHSPLRDRWDQPAQIHEVFGLILGLFLVFWTNRAYERWWEARTLWGQLVNTSRNQAVKLKNLLKLPASDLRQCESILIGFPYALKAHLREGCELKQVPGFADSADNPGHVPIYLVSLLYDRFRKWHQMELITGDELRILDLEATQLLEICGACERIRNTLIANSYRRFIQQLVVLHLIALPWGLAQEFGDATVVIVTIAAYFMIGVTVIAHAIEEPFGRDEDDLDLNQLCDKIEGGVREIFARQMPLNSQSS